MLGEQCYLATVERAEEVVACAVRTPPYGLVITRAEPSALDALVEDLIGKYETLPSVLGPEPTVSAFAQRWSTRVGTRTRPLMQMRMFEARQVQVPAVPPPRRTTARVGIGSPHDHSVGGGVPSGSADR